MWLTRISIHALLTESDRWRQKNNLPPNGFQSTLSSRRATKRSCIDFVNQSDFNPRSPHGERRFISDLAMPCTVLFQSTLSSRRATAGWPHWPVRTRDFNPRSPHGERPRPRPLRWRHRPDFNPRSPHGERHDDWSQKEGWWEFQSTLSSRRATNHAAAHIVRPVHFNPRSPHGERPVMA